MRISFGHREPSPLIPRLPRGIYPYLGGRTSVGDLRAAVDMYGCAAVPGLSGVKLARAVESTLVDPAQYASGPASPGEECLFDFDVWLERQTQARVPVVLTDSPQIRRRDRTGLKVALDRWRSSPQPTLVVLPIEPWWLNPGLPCLIDEVLSAQRPVALVLVDLFNGLDAAGSVAGLVAFMSALKELPVVLMRSDVSAVGAVAYGGFAGFIGASATNRHGPMPRRNRRKDGEDHHDRDPSPNVFVPALHDYLKASKLPSLSRDENAEILACYDEFCRGSSLLRLTRLSEVDIAAAHTQAYMHNMASHERVARFVLGSAEPKDAWWDLCRSGADTTASLIERGVSRPLAPWLRQWLELGSPSHEPLHVR
jgi:hypothetical protein